MNRMACIIAILYYIYQFIDSLYNKSIVIIIYNLIGIVILIISLIRELIQSRKIQITKKEAPYVNFALLYFLLGIQIDNLITYIDSEYYLGIILYIEGVLAFGILAIIEYIRFLFSGFKIKNLKMLYYIIIAIEILKILFMIIL